MATCFPTLTLLVHGALAQEPPPAEPVTAPREAPEPPAPVTAPRGAPASPERPLAIPASGWDPDAIDEQRANALRQYRARYLAVRSWNELRSTTVYSDVGYGYGYPYGGYGGVTIGMPWVWAEERMAVYRGPQRLSNPQYLEAVGLREESAELAGTIRGQRTVAGVLYGVAVAGGAATVASLVGMDTALTRQSYDAWRGVGLAGVGGLFVGAVGGSIPTARARRLTVDPTAIRSWDALHDEILTHNEGLRVELGLSPDDALKVEGAR